MRILSDGRVPSVETEPLVSRLNGVVGVKSYMGVIRRNTKKKRRKEKKNGRERGRSEYSFLNGQTHDSNERDR